MEPVMLHNPTDKVFECMSGGVVYIFEPKASRIILGPVAKQILKNQNTPLVQVEVQAVLPEEEVVVEEPKQSKYETMNYKELRSVATAKGLFKVGMKRTEVIELLNGRPEEN